MNTTDIRTCTKCNQTKSLSEFPTYTTRAGNLSKRHYCTECRKAKEQKWSHDGYQRLITETPNKYREKVAANTKKIRQNYQSRYKQRKAEYNRTLRPKQMVNSYHKVRNAIKSGKLVRPTNCSNCNKEGRIEAHHDDYTKPLEIRWLCRSCHSEHHRKYPHEHTTI